MPKISVIIPHYNDLENLVHCLNLLADQTVPAGDYEVIVVDNNSPIGIATVRDAVGPLARVIAADEQGAGPARNAGALAAAGRLLAFLDSDCRPAADWLAQAVRSCETAEIVGGRVDLFARDPQHLTPVEAFEAVFGFDNRVYVEKKGFSGTGNLVVRRDVFFDVGPFRNAVAEDLEWGRRATAMGYSIHYNDAMSVGHPSRHTWPELTRKWDKQTREGYLLMRQQPLGTARWLTRSVAVLVSPVPHAVRIMTSPRLTRFGDRLKAVMVLVRIRCYRFNRAVRLCLSGT